MLVPDHRHNIISEYNLAVIVKLRTYNINGLVHIPGEDAASGQVLRQIGADHLCSLHTDNGIHHHSIKIGPHHPLCHILGLTGSGL